MVLRSDNQAHDMGALEDRWAEIEREISWARSLRAELEQQGLRLRWARLTPEKIGAARFQTPDRLQRRFELAPELLFLFVVGHLQARHTRHGIPEAALSDRTNQALAFWADREPELEARLKRLPLPAGTWLPWSPGAQVETVLAQCLPAHDAFAQTQAVRGEQRMGRDALLASLQRDLEAHDAIGVYGLRKVGKTSLVFGLQERHASPAGGEGDDEAGWRVVYADAQSYLTEGMSALCGRLSHDLGVGGSASGGTSIGALRRAVVGLIEGGTMPCLIVDEFDWLFTHRCYRDEVVEFLAMIRGLVQTHPGRCKWVFVGREPSLLNGSRLAGFPNPTLNFWRSFWVPPLAEKHAGDLLVRLGRRMGLNVGYQSKARAYALTHGHPLLTRLYGSQLARLASAAPHPDREQNRPTDTFVTDAEAGFIRCEDAKNWSEEVFALLDDHHPSAGELLRGLATSSNRLGDWQAALELYEDEAQLLKDFGLVQGDAGDVPELLRQHVARYFSAREREFGHASASV